MSRNKRDESPFQAGCGRELKGIAGGVYVCVRVSVYSVCVCLEQVLLDVHAMHTNCFLLHRLQALLTSIVGVICFVVHDEFVVHKVEAV